MPGQARGTRVVPVGVESPDEVARYVCQMCVELRGLAADARLEMLALILDMAVEEADERAADAGHPLPSR